MTEGNSPLTVLVGTVTKEDPTLRFIPSGKAVCNFSIRVPANRKEGTDAYFQDINCWEQLAENVAESVRQGDRVIVRGILKTRSWEGQDGETKTRVELTAWNVGPDLSFAVAEVTRNERQDPPAPASTTPGYDESPF